MVLDFGPVTMDAWRDRVGTLQIEVGTLSITRPGLAIEVHERLPSPYAGAGFLVVELKLVAADRARHLNPKLAEWSEPKQLPFKHVVLVYGQQPEIVAVASVEQR